MISRLRESRLQQREMRQNEKLWSIAISSVIAYPSCLHWTPDGQLCFITTNAVYIFTPDHGINFDTGTAAPPSSKNLGWFKTMIETEKITPTKWTDYSQTWATVSLGSLDDSVVSIAISPTGLTTNGGCVVATLSANMDVVLWVAGKNFIKGEWVKISEITPIILARINPAECILQAQITSIEWTTQADFDLSPTPRLDCSILILGSRAGFITLLRFNAGNSVEYLQTLSISDQWITRLTFDSWNILAPGHCEGTLAYGASDGSVGLIKVSQRLKQSGVRSFTPRFDIEVAIDSTPQLVYPVSGNVGTMLKWVSIPGRSSVLVSSSPGLLKLFSQLQGSSTTHWTGYRVIRLMSSRNSPALYPASGLTYLPKLDSLVVTLADGSFHVVQSLSIEPDMVESSSLVANPENFRGWLTSDALSQTARMIHSMEKGNADQDDTCRIHGIISYDENATFMWAYEPFSPSDFSYKQDSKRSSTLIVSQLWNDNVSCGPLENLSSLLSSAKACWGLSPLHMLRPYFLHLGNPKQLLESYGQLLDILLPVSNNDCSKRVVIPSWDSRDINAELRQQFHISLATNLYGLDELLSLRMRLSLADFAWKMSGSEEIQTKCGVVAEIVLNAVSSRISRIIIRHWVAVAGLLDVADLPFASRLVVQSTLHGAESDLRGEGNELSALLQPIFNSSTGTTQDMYRLDEICPACGVTIPFEDVNSARCTAGHMWPRCSVTTFVLATCLVRTCVGCCRKAFLPPSALDTSQGQELPKIAQSWVVEELLNAVTKCLFCGNGFVSIL